MVRTEQGNAPHQQELPKGEVVFSKQLTLSELLNLSPEESSQKNLLDTAPFDFEVRDLGDSFLHIVSFSETQPVSLRELLPLLKAAKPGGISRKGQNTDGISADWRIILPELREKESTSRELYDFHKKYVPEFSEFEENHFELFWKVLETGTKGEKELSFLSHQLDQFIDEREFFAKYGRSVDFSDRQDILTLVYHISEYFRQFLLEEKDFNIPLKPEMDRFLKTYKLFGSMNEQEQRAFVIEFYRKIVDERGIEMERQFGRYLRCNEGVGYLAITTTTLIGKDDELNRIDGEGALKPLNILINEGGNPLGKEPDSFRRLDDGQIELQKGESFIRMSIVEGGDGYKKVKLGDYHLRTAETMVPLIVWQTDRQTGKRFYYCGKFDQLPKHDTLLGQLVVAAYSPEVRDQMPKEIKMKGTNGKEVTQPMLEASSVLLVPRHSKLFLTQSPVILALEALAK